MRGSFHFNLKHETSLRQTQYKIEFQCLLVQKEEKHHEAEESYDNEIKKFRT